MRLRTLALLAFALVMAGPLHGQQKRPFDTHIALDVRTPSIAALTDDGRFAVVTVRTRRGRMVTDHARFGDPTYVAPNRLGVLILDVANGTDYWLHEDPVQVRSLTTSPDGTRLGYLRLENGSWSLRIHDLGSNTTRTVALQTELEISSGSSLTWLPDGGSVVLGVRPRGWERRARNAFEALTQAPVIVQDSRDDFLAWDGVRNIAAEELTVRVSLDDGAVSTLLIDIRPENIVFTDDSEVMTFQTATRTKTSYTRSDGTDYALWRLDLDEEEPTGLIDPSESRIDVAWNDAGDAYAYAKKGVVFVRRLSGGDPVNLTDAHRRTQGDTASLKFSVERWSPDGEHLLVTSSKGWHLVDRDGDDMEVLLTLEEDEDERPRRQVVDWSANGRHLYFSYSAPDRWSRGLKRLDVATGRLDTVILDGDLYRDWHLSDDASTAVYRRSDGHGPDEVFAYRDGQTTQLTNLNPQLADIALARTELIEYLDVDGNTLYGILYYPQNYESGRRYPLVAEVYEEFFDNGYNENMNIITAQGWFGFRPSVRFEEGYPAEAWLKAVPNAINRLIERGLIDEEQVGVYGQSYGGYAVNLLITQTDRFAAAANVSGKVNMVSFLGDSPKITTRNYAAAEVGQDRIGATLWEQPQKYIDHSAVMFADRIETPLLMLSGEGDWNVPATNQREMYYAMRRLGKKVVWVHYSAGGHGAGRASTESDFHDHWRRMVEWFAEHFSDDTATTVGASSR